MNRYITYCFLILWGSSTSCFAVPVDLNGDYWQCTTHDATNTFWTSKSTYQKIALNFSYAKCKKNSKIPASCRTSKANCENFIAGVNVMPKWECTAFDKEAFVWTSNRYRHREDAALAALAYCKQKSPIPDTCYINLISCMNKQAL
ncbi:hypothetical protein [Legionella longbeachae]|uniref:DUF4189 domain-containing protein n=1 Tax=Legionella longbeachae serogroup 1 (strain NSW150) TaxID=661367 RepID=D3HT70_LEGLN|nr:hypothetical protein [Legionella longbeachae]VEE02604.1 Uncharacterised protein [Legionella oakridgensis]HBD7397866.1 hypothetical protein [Legionella pneumophila]ARB91130.1 hypothetical protein A6J40_02535 [Legionella longbeachae]ARM32442.1 hypothetical protein B0B39_02375 [Legionella longbeachae]EEZ94748.1 conserved hypothetical protein [Legionella longbeachae D-4968]